MSTIPEVPPGPLMDADAPPGLARISAGDFLMGAADAEEDQRPAHRVFVSEFFLGRYPVTHAEYARFVRATGHPPPSVRALPLIATGGRDELFRELSAPYVWGDRPPDKYASHPVVLVGYDDAVKYCGWLSSSNGRVFRLPTEAEWEKAARGGVDERHYPWGDEIDPTRCNFLEDPDAKRQRGTRPTGTYAPNAYGLYDVCGNVWEWVSDWYDASYYAQSERRDPAGPSLGALRIVRGGSWVNNNLAQLRCAYRHSVPPDTYAYSIGFRVACSA